MTEIKLHVAESFRPAFRFALLQQIPFVILCLLMLDCGWLAKLCGIAMLGFWIVAFTIMARANVTDAVGYRIHSLGVLPNRRRDVPTRTTIGPMKACG